MSVNARGTRAAHIILDLVDLVPYFICTVTHALSVDTDSPQAYVKRQLAWSRPYGVV